jgi:hypothetical protein
MGSIMSADPVERAARAHYHRRWTVSHPSWAQLSKPTRATLIGDMRAAIASLREPTPEIVEAGKRIRYGRTPTTGKMWTAMIDAALSCAAGESEEGK